MSTQKPVVSAIVISYFGRKFLRDCLTTLMSDLKGLSHEIVVVDNGSTDGSIDIIRQTCPNAVLVAHSKNLGFARAVNDGIRASHGECVWILNQDIRIRPGCIQTLLDRLKQNPRIGLIGPQFVGFDGRVQYSARSFPSHKHVIYKTLLLDRLFPRNREFGSWKMTWFDHETEMDVDQPMGAAMLIPRGVIDRVGLFDEAFPIFFNDVDYCRRIKMTGYVCRYCPSAVIEHFVGGSTRRQPVCTIIDSHKSLFRYLRKYTSGPAFPLVWMSGALLTIGLAPRVIGALFASKEPTEQAPTSVSR